MLISYVASYILGKRKFARENVNGCEVRAQTIAKMYIISPIFTAIHNFL